MKRWESLVRSRLMSAEFQDKVSLRDTVPGVLENIAVALSEKTSGLRLIEGSGISKEHGGQRSSLPLYRYQDIILEFRLLQQVIFEVLEEGGEIPPRDREIIRDSILVFVTDSVSEFLRVHQDLRQHFFLMLMHDLRGPLTAIKASAQMIIRFTDRAGSHSKQGHRIAENVERIDRMIGDLLDASRIQFGERLSLEIAEFDLAELIGLIEQEFTTIYGDRFKFQGDESVVGFWNADALRRCIENLVTNAVKYGYQGTPILISLTRSETRVQIRVHNEGDPLNPEEMSRLFEPFKRTESVRGQRGWGLGLTLVRGVAEAHGGRVTVESAPGLGTNFTMDLPLDARPFQNFSSPEPS